MTLNSFVVFRIIDQLMYTLPEDEDVPVKTILLANGFSPWGVRGGRREFIKNKCPVDRCSLTATRTDHADAILFKDHHTALNIKRDIKQVSYFPLNLEGYADLKFMP